MAFTSHPALHRLHKVPRSFLAGLLLISCLLGLAACAGNGANGKVQLKLWYWNRSIDDELIAQVSEQFPNIQLIAEKITDYDQKVRVSMAGHYGVPDIIAINQNIATYFPDQNQFVDLNTLGADELKSQYLDWKWNLGVTPEGKMIGFPMDSGPTGFFYRADVFEEAGLPSDPQEVSNMLQTWDDYFEAGVQIKESTNGQAFIIDSMEELYKQLIAQNPQKYMNEEGEYIADQEHMQQIWDTLSKANDLDISAGVTRWTPGWNQSVSTGRLAGFVGAVWMKQPLVENGQSSSGQWRVATPPGGPGNDGGSYLSVSSASQHPQEAFDVIKWLQSPENQATGYKTTQLFPSATSTLADPALQQAEEFYGGQNTTEIFAQVANEMPIIYKGPADDMLQGPFVDQAKLMEFQNKSSEQAWNDAQSLANRQLLR